MYFGGRSSALADGSDVGAKDPSNQGVAQPVGGVAWVTGGGAELCTELGKLEEEPIQGRNWESCCAPYSWDVFVSSHGNVGAGGLNLRLSI